MIILKIISFLSFFLFVGFVSADTLDSVNDTGFFSGVSDFYSSSLNFMASTSDFFFNLLPDKTLSFFDWLVYYIQYAKLWVLKEGLEVSYKIALALISDLNLTNILNDYISLLPNDVRQALLNLRFFEAIQLLIEAAITRLVYSML